MFTGCAGQGNNIYLPAFGGPVHLPLLGLLAPLRGSEQPGFFCEAKKLARLRGSFRACARRGTEGKGPEGAPKGRKWTRADECARPSVPLRRIKRLPTAGQQTARDA